LPWLQVALLNACVFNNSVAVYSSCFAALKVDSTIIIIKVDSTMAVSWQGKQAAPLSEQAVQQYTHMALMLWLDW
jgi:hypothetical protein